MVLATVANQALKSSGGSDMPLFQRGVEMPHTVPLLADPVKVNDVVFPFQKGGKRTVTPISIDAVDALFLNTTDARREASAQHGKSGKVNLGITVGIGEMLFDGQITFVIEKAIQDIGSVTVSTFDWDAAEGGVIVGNKRVKLESVILKPRTPGLLQHFLFISKSLAIAAGCFALSPMTGDIKRTNGIDQLRQRLALSFLR